MDADLQHPPEKVVELIEMIKSKAFVIGTRYAAENSIDKDWPVYRRVISSGARLLARPLSPLSDPMTGFFGISRKAYAKGGPFSPLGFKICLEMFVKVTCYFLFKAQIKDHGEVPIVFGARTEGESKLSSKVIVNYLVHLAQLYVYSMPGTLALLFVLILVYMGVGMIL
jgi:dolichol-phosphate mannosyltransferase